MTAFLKTKQWFKHSRLDQISTSVDACAIAGILLDSIEDDLLYSHKGLFFQNN